MDNQISRFLLGLGIGIGLGIALAPKSGRETREVLKTKATEGADYLSERGAEIADRAGEVMARGKEAVDRGQEKLGDMVEAGKRAYQNV